MRGLSIIRAATLAAAFVMASAGTASATILTSPAGTPFTGTVSAESEFDHMLVHTPSETFTCGHSTFDWKVESHGSSASVKGAVTKFTFEECGKVEIKVLKTGTLEVHTRSSEAVDYDPITWTGFELTIVRPSIFGPIHCVYGMPNIPFSLGGVTSSTVTGETATLDVESAHIAKVSGGAFCGEAIELTAAYTVTSPDYLDVD